MSIKLQNSASNQDVVATPSRSRKVYAGYEPEEEDDDLEEEEDDNEESEDDEDDD